MLLSDLFELPEGSQATTDEREARFLELRAWLVDWKDVAKIVIKRRDWLLELGIGKRRSRRRAASRGMMRDARRDRTAARAPRHDDGPWESAFAG